MSRKFLVSALALGCWILGTILWAGEADWQRQLDESAANLQAGHYAKAGAVADNVIGAMTARVGGGEAEARYFGLAVVYKALAAAGSGNLDDALWYWSIAQEISPAAAKTDLTPFGAAGEYLARHPAAPPQLAPVASLKIKKEVLPKFPAGASHFGIGGDLVVQIVVDRNGQPTLPHIVHALPAPALSYVALEALRQWRFQPATHNGETVPAVFNLTVHYKL